MKYPNITYHDYLQLDKILDSQLPRTKQLATEVHDETLFIIIHQVYELWFKQIIHELNSAIDIFQSDVVDDRSLSVVTARFNRVIEILKILSDQIRVLETMTPLDFLDFRDFLVPASGFQSFQFREVEVKLGLQAEKRPYQSKHPYQSALSKSQQETLEKYNQAPSFFELVDKWLARIPFLKFSEYNFIEAYKNSVENMMASDRQAILDNTILSEEEKNLRLEMLDSSKTYMFSIINPELHRKLRDSGEIRLSYEATFAALLINLYRDYPILQQPYNFLVQLVEIDDLIVNWRYKHASMVLKMLGKKVGTGGSSGYDYLMKTVLNQRIFGDFYTLSTLLIPRKELPALPNDLEKNLGFYYSV